MINRILVRIKAVQILYSYLLSRTDFKLNAAVPDASRDRRFAYSIYINMLAFITEASGCKINYPGRDLPDLPTERKLIANKVGKALAEDEDLRAAIVKNADKVNLLKPVIGDIYQTIIDSSAFKDYSRKRSKTMEDDAKFWTVALDTIVLKDEKLIKYLRGLEDFALSGFHRGITEAIETINSMRDLKSGYIKAKNELQMSLDRGYDLYKAIFGLIILLTKEEDSRLDAAKGKFLATSEDLNPDRRFVDNRFAAFLRNYEPIASFTEKNSEIWSGTPGLVKGLLDLILASDIYREYMSQPTSDWYNDCEFWRAILRQVVFTSELFSEAVENGSIYWGDDLGTVGTFALKTIRKYSLTENGEGLDILPQFKDEEDAQFGNLLFTAAADHRDEYREYIDRFINKDWDPDRIAFMDLVIMTAAIAEMLEFPAIPLAVTLNEYIEIANNYSTSRSGAFINGILYSVINMLIDEGKIRKPFVRVEDKE